MTWTDLIILGFVVLFSGIGFGFFSVHNDLKEKYPIMIVIIGLCIWISGFLLESIESHKIMDESKGLIDSWNCDNLGENILVQIKNDNSTLLDYQKDLYHFKCEVKP